MDNALIEAARRQLAPQGILRAGINLSNFLLVTGKDEQDQHVGVSPGIAKSLAEALSVPLQLVPFPGPGSYLSPCVFLEREKVNYEQEKNTSEKIVITAALLPSLLLRQAGGRFSG